MKPKPLLRGVYAITDDALLPPAEMLPKVEEALAAGIRFLQYRSKSTDADSRLRTARELAALCTAYEVPLIINDAVDLAIEADAQGVHLGRQDAPVAEARARLGPEALIGASCHADLALALKAEEDGADYVAFGRFFPSATKPAAPAAPLAILGEAKQRLRVPVVAIGGIQRENGAAALQAGADMLAAVHAVFGGDDVAGDTRALCALFQRKKHADE